MGILVGHLEGFLDLEGYSEKYGVSLSTLRRRIRSNAIGFKLYKGRYWIEDSSEALGAAPLFARHINTSKVPAQNLRSFLPSDTTVEKFEKENRVLKAQVAELETLVRILEDQLAGQ